MSDTAEQNTAIVRRLMDALNVCDMDRIGEILHPDCDWWVLGLGTMSRDTVLQQLQAMLGGAKVAETTIIGTTAEGPRVAVESRGNFVFADGRVYRNEYHHLFVLENGQVMHVREYLDTALVARVFGALPQQPA